MMTGSINFFLHIIMFGLAAGMSVALLVINQKFSHEQELSRKLVLSDVMRTIFSFNPYIVGVLIVTGVGNMMNRYGMSASWPQEMWLMSKIAVVIFFAAIMQSIVPRLHKQRTGIFATAQEQTHGADITAQINSLTKRISLLLFLQSALLLIIVLLSVFGDGKHPGFF